MRRYRLAVEDNQMPSVEKLRKSYSRGFVRFLRTSIAVDSLDEYDSWNRKEIAQLLRTLKSLNCNVLITSRNGPREFQ